MTARGPQVPTQRPGASHRIAALDGLRGLAVLLVVVSHVSSYHAEQAGPAGVAVFFTLSGFLITSLLLAESGRPGRPGRPGRIDLQAFYGRRALRLFPALGLLVAATPLVLRLAGDPRLPGVDGGLLTALFYVQDVAGGLGHPGVLGHTWSLAVEEQFYLIWPFVLGLLLRAGRGTARDPRRLARVVTALAAAALAWHLVGVALLPFDWTFYGPDANAVFLLTGCALAAQRRAGHRLRLPRAVAAASLAALVLGPLVLSRVEVTHWRGQAALMLPVCLLGLPVIMGADRLPVLELPVLRWFGTVSYGVYLWNWLFISLRPHGRLLDGEQRLVAAVAAVGVAAASWYLVEHPILRYKRRFERTSLSATSFGGAMQNQASSTSSASSVSSTWSSSTSTAE